MNETELHAMIDIEATGRAPHGIVACVGAVKFDPLSDTMGSELYLKPDMEEQKTMGRTEDPDNGGVAIFMFTPWNGGTTRIRRSVRNASGARGAYRSRNHS